MLVRTRKKENYRIYLINSNNIQIYDLSIYDCRSHNTLKFDCSLKKVYFNSWRDWRVPILLYYDVYFINLILIVKYYFYKNQISHLKIISTDIFNVLKNYDYFIVFFFLIFSLLYYKLLIFFVIKQSYWHSLESILWTYII